MRRNTEIEAAIGEASSRQPVLCARVPSKEQEREGYSIPAEEVLLRGYALEHGVDIVREFDEVETGKDTGRSKFHGDARRMGCGRGRQGPRMNSSATLYMLRTVGQPTGQSGQAMAGRGRAQEEWVVTVNYVGNSSLPLAAAYRALLHDDAAASGGTEELEAA